MNIKKEQLKLYAITDSNLLKDGESLAKTVEDAIIGGATVIQLREKGKPAEEVIETAKELKLVCGKYGVPLIVNDSIDIASKSGADGVHLGIADGDPIYARHVLGDKAIIGVTAHSLLEAQMAMTVGADYVGCGAVFQSKTKHNTVPISIEELKTICRRLPDFPVVAIGGINAENIVQLKDTGIAGIAVVSAIFGGENVRTSAALLKGITENLL